MRPSLIAFVRPIPLSTIPPSLLRLPPKASPTTVAAERRLLKSRSPTIKALSGRIQHPSDLQGASSTFANLRIEEYVPKRREWEGVQRKHRVLLEKLRREA